jgi:hypothetical protein
VRSDLAPIFTLNTDVACAANHSRSMYAEQLSEHDRRILRRMEWQTGEKVYYNGGVLFFNDTVKSRELSSKWHQFWLSSYRRCEDFRDQPALNAALYDVKPSTTLLSEKFNAQFRFTPKAAKEAHVWHYYGSAPEANTEFELHVEKIARGLELGDVKKITTSKYPWRCDGLSNRLAAAWLLRCPDDNCWAAYLLRRELRVLFLVQITAMSQALARLLSPQLRWRIRRLISGKSA